MTALFTLILWLLALCVFVPAVVLFFETAASFLPRRLYGGGVRRGVTAIVVPAHNEGAHMAPTLIDLKNEMEAGDRLIVVADNCTDDTAAVAVSHGAEVLKRDDPQRRGKGYALQFAIEHLKSSPPDFVAFFDADCRIAPGSLETLVAAAAQTERPAQALYEMSLTEGASPRSRVSAFAWSTINDVRMSGLSVIADTTRFTGAGLAAPWEALSSLDFGGDALTEDLELTLKLADNDAAPVFTPDAVVTSFLPENDDASMTQRARWEHGSLGVLFTKAPAAFWRGASKGDLRQMALALDAMIPPLFIFLMALGGVFLLTLVGMIFSDNAPVKLVLWSLGLVAVSIVACWLRTGHKALPPDQLGALIPFLLEKLRIYGREGRASAETWTRTERDGGDTKD